VPSDKKLLVLVQIISYFIPEIPHPVLIIYGSPGSGKSSFTEFCRSIIDPSKVPKLTIDRSNSAPTKNIGGVVKFGNLYGYPYEWYYKAKINALLTTDRANILAKPKITTINGKEAEINIGSQVPVKKSTTTSNGITDTSIEYKDVGIKLKYTPRINPDGYITAKIRAEVNAVTEFNTYVQAYTFTQKSAETNVRLKDGETMVIGGLIDKSDTRTINKVPILGEIPILGALFKNSNSSKVDKEVVIFLTAHIVK
jgi:type IV pilus assembly protein PilQ